MALLRKLGKDTLTDIFSVSFILILGIYITFPLFNWSEKVLDGDIAGMWAWLYWFKECLLTYHQFPTWSPLWMGGIPFFGMVPPMPYILPFFLYLVIRDIPGAYNLSVAIIFCFAGVAMYLFLREYIKDWLTSLFGAVYYLILPVHVGSMLTMGHFGILIGYAFAPLVLMFTKRSLKRGGVNIILFSISLTFLMLSQIEYTFLFMLFLYIPFIFILFFTGDVDFHKFISLDELMEYLKKNLKHVILALLILCIPLRFYVSVFFEQNNFSMLKEYEVEAGLHFWTFKNFFDPFYKKADSWLDLFSNPPTEYYLGILPLCLLLLSLILIIFEKNRYLRTKIAIFSFLMFTYLLLCLGVYGPIYPFLREIITPLKHMRVPLRFFYLFAISSSVLFAVVVLNICKKIGKILENRKKLRLKLLIEITMIFSLIVIPLVDFSTYFNFYENRILDRKIIRDDLLNFFEDSVYGKNSKQICRVLVSPEGIIFKDQLAKIYNDGNVTRLIEIMHSWLSWTQYKDAVNQYDLAVSKIFSGDPDAMNFYTNLYSIDYILLYGNRIPPAPLYNLYSQRLKTSKIYASEGYLTEISNISTKYYDIHLFKTKNRLNKIRFYPINSTILLVDDNPFVSEDLFKIYMKIKESERHSKILWNSTQKGFWKTAGYGKGNISIKVVKYTPLQILITSGNYGYVEIYHDYEKPQNFSSYDSLIFKINGANTGRIIRIWLCTNPGIDYYYWDIIDNFQNWKTVTIFLNDPSGVGGKPNLSNIRRIAVSFLAGGKNVTYSLSEIRLAKSKYDCRDFLKKIVVIDKNIINSSIKFKGIHNFKGELLIIDNKSNAEILEAEDLKGKGWIRFSRSIRNCVNYDYDMAIPDVTKVGDNYLEGVIRINKSGEYIIDVYYYSYFDTGVIEIYIDGKKVIDIDTYGQSYTKKHSIFSYNFSEGEHKITIAGKIGKNGNKWVEIDRIFIVNKAELSEMLENSKKLLTKIMSFLQHDTNNGTIKINEVKFSPRGLRIKVEAKCDGVLSLTYYYNPWWEVYIDGKKGETLRINGIFMGTYIPKGKHTVSFNFNYQ